MSTNHFFLWLPMIVIAFANATIRELILVKHLDALKAQQWSTVTLIIFCSVYTFLIFPSLRINDWSQAFRVGVLWTVLTVLFEFGLGRVKSWSELFQQYDVMSGHLWPMFLLWLFFLPYLCYLFRK